MVMHIVVVFVLFMATVPAVIVVPVVAVTMVPVVAVVPMVAVMAMTMPGVIGRDYNREADMKIEVEVTIAGERARGEEQATD